MEFKPEIMSLGCPPEPLQDGMLCVLNSGQGELVFLMVFPSLFLAKLSINFTWYYKLRNVLSNINVLWESLSIS